VAIKLYPSAHITHGAMAALADLRAREGLRPDDVASVTATLHPGGADVLIHDDPATGLQAKFSIQFCLAAVLREGSPGLAEFTEEYVDAPETRNAMATVEVDYDADAVAELGRYGGLVRVETADGAVYEAEGVDAPGSPLNPADEERLRRKFDECVAPTSVDGEELATAIAELENRPLANVLEPLRAASN
jgi:2-methylcitrate dehydratase PrpD